MKNKIAVMTDSGSDIKQEISKDLFLLPLTIQIDDDVYTDGVDIELDEVLSKIDDHKVKTSLPNPEIILKKLDEIKSLGYTHLIIHTISSGLSGTYNVIRMLIEDYEGLEIALIDTRNISKGSGYTAYKALEMIEQGLEFDVIVKKLEENLDNHKVFFTIGTVEYLRKGGRIGLVASTVASILNIKPIISCNEKGVYYTIKKSRGYYKAIEQLIQTAFEFVENTNSYDLTILIAKVDERIERSIQKVKDLFTKVRNLEIKTVTPALAIHTGAEAFGIVVSKNIYK